jgi:hypothetical protein
MPEMNRAGSAADGRLVESVNVTLDGSAALALVEMNSRPRRVAAHRTFVFRCAWVSATT